MKSNDARFLQAYIELDDICKQKFNSEKGITLYIEKMQQRHCDSEEIKTLKRLRYIRNKLVHEPNADISYTSGDIQFLVDFKSSVREKKDPLAKSVRENKSTAQAIKRKYLKSDKRNSSKKRKRKNDLQSIKTIFLPFVICFALVIIVLLALNFVK